MNRIASRFVGFLREAVTDNLALKLVSLVISLVLFGAVRGAGNVQRSVDVPLTVVLPTTVTGGPVLLSTLPDKVRVTLRGPPSVLSALRADDLGPLQVDLREGRPRSIRLRSDLVSLPAGASLLSLVPDTLPLQWDVLVERSLPIRGSVVGALRPRARIERIEVDPTHVRVRGAALFVDPLAAVHTEPIDASGLAPGRYERRIPLELPRVGVEYEGVHGVSVSFEVVLPVYERRFEHVPITAIGASRVQLLPPVVDVVVRGEPVIIDRMIPSQVVPVVDLTAMTLSRGTMSVPVDLRPLPSGVTVGAREPTEVLVMPQR